METNDLNGKPDSQKISVVYDLAINYAFQQNAIPVIKELRYGNDAKPRKNLVLRITTEPAFAELVELRLQAIDAATISTHRKAATNPLLPATR